MADVDLRAADVTNRAIRLADILFGTDPNELDASMGFRSDTLSQLITTIFGQALAGTHVTIDKTTDGEVTINVALSAADLLASLLTVDGPGSGLDADLLDGMTPAEVAALGGGGGSDTATQILTKLLTVDGDGSGLDADLLKGMTPAQVAALLGGGGVLLTTTIPSTVQSTILQTSSSLRTISSTSVFDILTNGNTLNTNILETPALEIVNLDDVVSLHATGIVYFGQGLAESIQLEQAWYQSNSDTEAGIFSTMAAITGAAWTSIHSGTGITFRSKLTSGGTTSQHRDYQPSTFSSGTWEDMGFVTADVGKWVKFAVAHRKGGDGSTDITTRYGWKLFVIVAGEKTITGLQGADSVVPGPQGNPGAASIVPGPPGADSIVPGPQGNPGADSIVPGPTGADSTVPGPIGQAGANAWSASLTAFLPDSLPYNSPYFQEGTVTDGGAIRRFIEFGLLSDDDSEFVSSILEGTKVQYSSSTQILTVREFALQSNTRLRLIFEENPIPFPSLGTNSDHTFLFTQARPGDDGPQGNPGADSIVPGPTGADSTVPGPQGNPGADSIVPGPAGADSIIPGPQGNPGADSIVPGPAGADSTVPGPQGNPGADGAGAAPAEDEGNVVVATPSAYNFVGEGVLVTESGGKAVVTIPGVPVPVSAHDLIVGWSSDTNITDIEIGAGGTSENDSVVIPTQTGTLYLFLWRADADGGDPSQVHISGGLNIRNTFGDAVARVHAGIDGQLIVSVQAWNASLNSGETLRVV